ncbi:MAG: transcriptional regulator [Desulfobacterales bacterium]
MNSREKHLPIPVKRALKKLGNDIRKARLRRRISTQVMAERVSITRTTLAKAEQGHPGVSIGIFATILFTLGMLDRLSELAGSSQDLIGLDLEEERLPKRIRQSNLVKG